MSNLNIVALSDVHLRSSNPIARKDNIVKTQFKKLKFVFDYADKHNCIILQAGDFLDKARDWNLLIMLIEFFEKYPKVQMHCILGQHDSYFYSKTKGTTLGILERMEIINILTNSDTKNVIPYQINYGWNIYGNSWGEPLPIVKTKLQNNILITHRSIADTQIYPGQKYTDPQNFLKSNPEYNLIIVGDIHRSFNYISSDGRHIVNTGPMLRAEATEYNIDHHTPHFWHFNIDNSNQLEGHIVSIPHKPSEEVLSRSHIIERSDVDITEMSQLLDRVIDQGFEIKNIFSDNSIKPKTRRLLKEIYNNAKQG